MARNRHRDDTKCDMSPVTCRCGREHTIKLSKSQLRKRVELLTSASSSSAGNFALVGRDRYGMKVAGA